MLLLSRKYSFTLIESIVVIAIIGAVAAMTGVSITVIDSRQLKSDIHRLLADLQWAREMAMTRHQDYTVSIDISNNSYTITGDSEPRRLAVDITNNTNITTITFSSHLGDLPAGRITNFTGDRFIELGYRTRTPKRIRLESETGYARVQIQDPPGGWCFIATAAYGPEYSKDIEELVILRKFRDKYLLSKRIGRILVKFYYTVSPPIASYIEARPWAQRATRVLLVPIIYACKKILAG